MSRKKRRKNAGCQKRYSVEDAISMVVDRGLRPAEALRATKEPCSRQVLGKSLSDLRREVAREAVENGVDASAIVRPRRPSPTTGWSFGGGGGKKRGGVDGPSWWEEELAEEIERIAARRRRSSAAVVAVAASAAGGSRAGRASVVAPPGGEAVATTTDGAAEDPTEEEDAARRLVLAKEERDVRYAAALREATERWHGARIAKSEGKKGEKLTAIIAECNEKHGLVGGETTGVVDHRRLLLGEKASRETNKVLTPATVRRYVQDGLVGAKPKKKGPKSRGSELAETFVRKARPPLPSSDGGDGASSWPPEGGGEAAMADEEEEGGDDSYAAALEAVKERREASAKLQIEREREAARAEREAAKKRRRESVIAEAETDPEAARLLVTKEERDARYEEALKEATIRFDAATNARTNGEENFETMKEIIDDCNDKYGLEDAVVVDGNQSREGSRLLARATVRRYVKRGLVGVAPTKKGPGEEARAARRVETLERRARKKQERAEEKARSKEEEAKLPKTVLTREERDARYEAAMREATLRWRISKTAKDEGRGNGETIAKIAEDVNVRHGLDRVAIYGETDETRETCKRVTPTTVIRHVALGRIGEPSVRNSNCFGLHRDAPV